MTFEPFADDASLGIAGLTIENGPDRIAIYGSLDLTRDRKGLADAQALKTLLDSAIARLEAQPNLPAALPAPAHPKTVRNPFT